MWWVKGQSESLHVALTPLGTLESQLMERIWRRGEASVRDLHSEFAHRLAYTTVMTTLDRLYKKGLLRRRKAGKAYCYAAVFGEKEYREHLARHLIGMALHDNRSTSTVLSCFVDTVSKADQEMLDRLDELVKAKRRALRRRE
ncbi:MAG TPA: BlaI/MecI/CopY family transcriptional regulator [Verrucomicrobiae bacterium]|jgi:predicted transcriptional regulator|nr:BlaI/MecI/CopY family transcriptional regulator [Verrucomicrobiae bacterium]